MNRIYLESQLLHIELTDAGLNLCFSDYTKRYDFCLNDSESIEALNRAAVDWILRSNSQ